MLGIVTSVANLATTFIDSKAKVKAAEAETKMKLATGEINWEQAAINASKDSFKDELWTGVFVLILAAMFHPCTSTIYGSRLRELNRSCPDWVTWGMYASIASSFGFRAMRFHIDDEVACLLLRLLCPTNLCNRMY